MPQLLRLISLTGEDLQSGDGITMIDNFRFYILLDGKPVKWIGENLMKGVPYNFNEVDNRTDLKLTGNQNEFIFWTSAEITAYEADAGVTLTDPVLDANVDDWVQTIRLDHRLPGRGKHTIRIGKESEEFYLANGRTDVEWNLTYELRDYEVKFDPSLFNLIASTKSESEKLADSNFKGDFNRDKGSCKWICSIDGGGLRGIFALRMLEQLEAYYGKSCFEMFDMFAGTSTGSIIASLLACGYPLKDVISFYANDEIRKKIFSDNRKGQHHAIKFWDLRTLGDADAINDLNDSVHPNKYIDMIEAKQDVVEDLIETLGEQIMTPKYRKTGLKELLYQVLSTRGLNGLTPITLGKCGKEGVYKDILITARDLQRSETTFFTAFHFSYVSDEPREDETKNPSGPVAKTLTTAEAHTSNPFLRNPLPRPRQYPGKVKDFVTGTYRDVLLKDAVEASASAPVYFTPRSQFSDGGIGAHNNPAFMAAIEALRYSTKIPEDATDVPEKPLEPKYTRYSEKNGNRSGSVVWSFGTSYTVPNPDAQADIPRIISGSMALRKRTDHVLYWVEQVIDNLMYGANQEQDFLCRVLLRDDIKYLRFNLGVNKHSLDQLDIDRDRKLVLDAIKLDAFEPEKFQLMDEVAKQFALYARNERFGFENGGYEIKGRADIPLITYAATVKQNFKTYE